MKYLMITAAVAATALAMPAFADNYKVGQPGYYGRLDVNSSSKPQVINSNPVSGTGASSNRAPIYLRVPAGDISDWQQRCQDYNACNERVYFVQDNWYKQNYASQYQEEQVRRQQDPTGRRDSQNSRVVNGRTNDVQNDNRNFGSQYQQEREQERENPQVNNNQNMESTRDGSVTNRSSNGMNDDRNFGSQYQEEQVNRQRDPAGTRNN